MKTHIPWGFQFAALAVCLVLCAPPARAAKDFAVTEDLIVVSPPDENGVVTVSGPPGAVRLGPNATATFALENQSQKPWIQPRQGVVGPDGSFSAQIPASPGHKIRITIGSLAGGSKKIKRKVPAAPVSIAPPDKGGLFSQSSAPPKGGAGAPAVPPIKGGASLSRRWASPIEPTPEITINYRTGSSKPASSPLDPDDEVRQSGVLPPGNL